MIEERDVMGRLVRLERPACRVVSLVPSLTELFFAWGRGNSVVGRTTFCVEPAGEVEAVPRVGGTKNLKAQSIVEMEPDLVVGSVEENTREDVQSLLDAGLQVYLTLPSTVEDAVAMLAPLGRLTGAEDQAAALATQTRAAIKAVHGTAPVNVFCPIWRDPYMTCGPGTYMHDLLRVCGGQSLFDELEGRYPVVTQAQVAERDPQVILFPDEPFPFAEKHLADWAAYRDGMQAFRAGRVHFLDGKLVSWYGPRMPAALREIAALLHP
jgi:ABC-type Fe3+-hydroxamate transport system substrate-binding protein